MFAVSRLAGPHSIHDGAHRLIAQLCYSHPGWHSPADLPYDPDRSALLYASARRWIDLNRSDAGAIHLWIFRLTPKGRMEAASVRR